MSTTCYAPVFKPRSTLECILQAIVAAFALPLLVFALLVTLGSPAILCEIRRRLFSLQHCRSGNTDATIDLLADAYTRRVRRFRNAYGKDAAWEQWMEDNRDRYLAVFRAVDALPRPTRLAFRYDSAPIAYNPPWANEAEHMAAIEAYLEASYAGYDFQVLFGADPSTTYGAIVAGIPTNSSHADGRTVYLYYEAILHHEFGHVLALQHHYDSLETIGDGLHMPPGDTACVMDRNSSQFCSACRTALNIPLDIDNATAIASAANAIAERYPY